MYPSRRAGSDRSGLPSGHRLRAADRPNRAEEPCEVAPTALLLDLQRSAGNSAVNRLLRNGYMREEEKVRVRNTRAYWRSLESQPAQQTSPPDRPPRQPLRVQWPPPTTTAEAATTRPAVEDEMTTEPAVEVPRERDPGPIGDRQAFGTAIPHKDKGGKESYSDDEKVAFLKQALQAGYRFFDTAESYETLHLLERAARESSIDFGEIMIAHKIKPPTDAELRTTKGAAGNPANVEAKLVDLPQGMRKILMLHELSDNWEINKTWLEALASASTPGLVSVGVSNVSIEVLRLLYEFASKFEKVELEFVQNPCSPYHQDLEVRRFCSEKSITYMAFGLFGRQSLGVCDEGFAVPAQHLQVLDDPRIQELAKKASIKATELLLAWASRRGITVVIYSGSHAKENAAALDIRVSDDVLRAIDALSGFDKDSTTSEHKDEPKLRALYEAYQDATAWYVLDLLAASPKVAELLGGLVDWVHAKEKSPETVTSKLEHIVLRILRFVTHVQTEIRVTGQDVKWTDLLVQYFERAARDLGDAPTLEHLYAWTQTDYFTVGGGAHAADEFQAASTQHRAKEKEEASAPSTAAQQLTHTWESFMGRFQRIVSRDLPEKDAGNVNCVAVDDIVEAYSDTMEERWKIVSIDKTQGVKYEYLGPA